MKTIDTMKELLDYCNAEDTYVLEYKDWICYLKNGETFKFKIW